MDKLQLVIVGHVDHGKSSLIGRILYETNAIPSDKIAEVYLENGEIEFSRLLDHLQEEREQEITIETTRTYFSYKNQEIVIIDCPGHVEFTKNMVTGAAQANLAVVIVDVSEGIKEQTIRHSYLLSILDIKKVIVVVNKMDKVGYCERRFRELCNSISNLFSKFDIHIQDFIPTSVVDGVNICSKSDKASWYCGNTLMDSLLMFKNEESFSVSETIFPVQDVFKCSDKRLINGRLESGKLCVEDRIFIYPGKRVTKVKSIDKFGVVDCQNAQQGESFGFTTIDPVFVERGNIVCSTDKIVKESDELVATVFWMNPAKLEPSDEISLRCTTQNTKGHVISIQKVINTKSLEIEAEKDYLENLYVGKVTIKLKKAIFISTYSENKIMGRIVLLRNEEICGGGLITNIGGVDCG